MAASDQLPHDKLLSHEFVGELALSGELRVVKGVLPAALAANKSRRCLVVPEGNGNQAALVGREHHKSASGLLDVCAYLMGQQALSLYTDTKQIKMVPKTRDLQDIIGQQQGKRALEIAAAGNHNLLFLGPPKKHCGRRRVSQE